MPSLSIVIPAYNEADRLPPTLASIAAFFATARDDLDLHDVIVVDDGSTDGTADVAARWSDRLPVTVHRFPSNRGKGAAVREGMLRATGELRLIYDADGATPIEEVPKLRRAMREQGAEVAIGSRVDPSTHVRMKPHRRLIGRIYHALCSPLHPGIRDAACGCKLFTAASASAIFPKQQIDRFAFDVEILSLAIALDYRIAEIPVPWTAVEKSKVRLIRDGIQMFWSVLGLYWRRWRSRA